MKIVKVETLLSLYIKVPEGFDDKQAVYNFMANNVSYSDAFMGIKDDEMIVDDVIVVDEEVVDMDYEDCDD